MTTTIITKNSSTAGAAPLAADLVQGELAVNVTSKALYTKNASAAVVKLNTPSIVDNGDATAITIDSSENVGIGTSSPANKLSVNANSAGGTSARFTDGTNSTLLIDHPSSGVARLNAFTQLAFATGNTTAATIDSSGNLLVGTTSQPSGTGKTAVAFNAGSSVIGTVYSLEGASSGTAIRFYNNPTVVGSIALTASATAYNTSSDYRLKNTVEPMTGALARVAALKPVTYKWNVDGADGEGFIAHELAEVVPDAVTGEKDAVESVEIKDEEGNIIGTEERPVYQGIDTSFLVATLTAAIQEQQTIIDAQASVLTSLTARIEALEAK